MSEASLIEARNLSKEFSLGGLLRKRKIVAVDGVSFDVSAGNPTILTIAGESGSGKTTTARLILGFMKPTSGEVIYRGRNIWKMTKDERKDYRREVQAIFQDPYGAFNPLFRVDGVLTTPLKEFGLAASNEIHDVVRKSLEVVGLRPDDVLGKYPHQLSGGQRQRIMLARAFLLRPKLIVADEPVSMIDASIRASILKIMQNLRQDYSISFIYITHDLSTAYQISDQIIVMYAGGITEMGPVEKVVGDPLHPYVKTLISSIPVPDPEAKWRRKIVLPIADEDVQSPLMKGCKFHNRCRQAEEKCAKERPRLVDVGGRLVACHQCQ